MSKTMDDMFEKRKHSINNISSNRADQRDVWKMVSVEEILQKPKKGAK